MKMVDRRTISLPEHLARRVEAVAKKEKGTFSGTVARLLEESLNARKSPFTSLGAAHSGVPDLGLNAEAYLREIFESFDD